MSGEVRSLWRIASDTASFVADDMTGGGAKVFGGRWNNQGVPMVYAASTRALACLETIAHLQTQGIPFNRYLVEIRVPAKVWECRVEFEQEKMVGWDALPAGKVSLDWGDEWAKGKSSLLACVPSVVVPEEMCVIINPLHPDAGDLTARKVRKWVYDPRILV